MWGEVECADESFFTVHQENSTGLECLSPIVRGPGGAVSLNPMIKSFYLDSCHLIHIHRAPGGLISMKII